MPHKDLVHAMHVGMSYVTKAFKGLSESALLKVFSKTLWNSENRIGSRDFGLPSYFCCLKQLYLGINERRRKAINTPNAGT